jgi:hypothetical protein
VNRFRRFRLIHHYLKQSVTRAERTAHQVKHASIIQSLNDFIGSEHRFGVFNRCII